MKTKVLLTILVIIALTIIGCSKKPCPPPKDSKSSPVLYCNHPQPPIGLQHVVAWITALYRDGAQGEASVEVDYLRIFYYRNGEKILQYADEYDDPNRYMDWTYGGLYLRKPWYGYDQHSAFKDGSFGTKIEDGDLFLPVSTIPDRVWHPVSTCYPIPEVPIDIEYFVIEAKFSIDGDAQVQVGFDCWSTKQAGIEPHTEGGASDWYCGDGTYKLSLKFDRIFRGS